MKTRPTRRDFLEAALVAGASAAVPAYLQEAGGRRIPARFVGDAFERGHHWITPDPEKLHVDRREKRDVVIVGAGMAGVVAAWRLQAASVEDFVVLELEDKAGGLARSGTMGKTIVPFGGVTMAVPDAWTSPVVLRLLEAAGVDRSRTREFSPTVIDGSTRKPWDVRPSSFVEFSASRPFNRFVRDLTRSSEADDRLTVEDWLAREKASRDVVRFANRWCLLRFGARPAAISFQAFLIDAGSQLLSDRHTLVIPGGFSTLLAPLVEKTGPRLLPGRVALLVKPGESGATVRAVNALDASVTDFEAKVVVLAVPPFIAARITPVLRERQRDLAIPETTPWLVTAVMVSGWPKGFDPALPFHQCPDERAALIVHAGTPPEAVIISHRPFPSAAATPARMFLRDLDPESARDWALRELAPVFPDLAALATRLELCRVGHGSIRPSPGFMTEIAPKLRAPAPPIYPCGADYTGLPSAESAIEDGVRGAEEVLKSLGKLDKSWL